MGLGMDGEEILKTFYETVPYEKRGEGWVTPYKAERWRGVKPEFDLVDADTGEVIAQAGQKISARAAKKVKPPPRCVAGRRRPDHQISGQRRRQLRDRRNLRRGRRRAGRPDHRRLEQNGFTTIEVLDIDHVGCSFSICATPCASIRTTTARTPCSTSIA